MSPFRDVVVLLPGIMGSTLLDRSGAELWGPSTSLAAGEAPVPDWARRLRLPEGIDDGHPGDGIRPGTVMSELHLVPGLWSVSVGYDRLLNHLRRAYELIEAEPGAPDRPVNLVPFAYDWRLSNRYNARRLKCVIEPVLERWRAGTANPDAKLILICHSMGGLVARWYLDVEGGAAQTRALITIGTPHQGAASTIDRLANGVRRSLGPIGADLTQLARSLPALHQLLPSYACVDTAGATLGRTTDVVLPGLSTRMVTDAMEFHRQLDAAHATPPGYALHPIVGVHQPTDAGVRLDGGLVTPVRALAGDDARGDGVVPRFAALPAQTSPPLHQVGETHRVLPANRVVLDQIDAIIRGTDPHRPQPRAELGVRLEDFTLAGEPITVFAESSDTALPLEARVRTADTARWVAGGRLANLGEGRYAATYDDIPPGGYEVAVGRRHPAGHLVEPVSTATVVLDPGALTPQPR